MQIEHNDAARETKADELEALSLKWQLIAREVSGAKRKHPNGKGWWH